VRHQQHQKCARSFCKCCRSAWPPFESCVSSRLVSSPLRVRFVLARSLAPGDPRGRGTAVAMKAKTGQQVGNHFHPFLRCCLPVVCVLQLLSLAASSPFKGPCRAGQRSEKQRGHPPYEWTRACGQHAAPRRVAHTSFPLPFWRVDSTASLSCERRSKKQDNQQQGGRGQEGNEQRGILVHYILFLLWCPVLFWLLRSSVPKGPNPAVRFGLGGQLGKGARDGQGQRAQRGSPQSTHDRHAREGWQAAGRGEREDDTLGVRPFKFCRTLAQWAQS
jgi:hypothetical protein